MHFTAQQEKVIAATGNVLVMAGAGTGKTRTLVERCVRRILDPASPISLREILIVTFTEAAAAELRVRLRGRLESVRQSHPDDERWSEQLALLDRARICTLHSFCLELVREHACELKLDPQLAVLDEAQSAALAAASLDEVLRRHYAGEGPEAEAVQKLIAIQGRGWDQPIRDLMLQVHDFTQARPEPREWFHLEESRFSQATPERWRGWLGPGFEDLRTEWLPRLRQESAENLGAQRLAALLDEKGPPTPDSIRRMLDAILAIQSSWPSDAKKMFNVLKKFFEDALFLRTLLPANEDGPDPLWEDWNWARPEVVTLLRLTREFIDHYAASKRDRAALDFHDLEQFALALLWDSDSARPSELAHEWRRRLKLIFVDEYQDINYAQDRVLSAISRDGPEANRFLVGDPKQSIYRFRQAEPAIFQRYKESWSQSAPGGVLALSENFRSHEMLLRFLNPLFEAVMSRETESVEFDSQSGLSFGNPVERRSLSAEADPVPRAHVHLLLRGTASSADGSEGEEAAAEPRSEASLEARLIARLLIELRQSSHRIVDEKSGEMRPVQWRDMVVLLRSPRSRVESFAKEFASLDVPLEASQGGFFDSLEVTDLLNVLRLLDNPLQDAPAVAVLRSPLVGLALDDLATLRLAMRPSRFWIALVRWHQEQKRSRAGQPRTETDRLAPPQAQAQTQGAAANAPADDDSLWSKVDRFLERYQKWRRVSRHASTAQRLEMVLSDTCYLEWLAKQPRGSHRIVKVQHLLHLARQFDRSRGQGLFRFLQFLHAQEEAGATMEPPVVEAGNAVRLMSIHQSKGLEFPVVVVAGLGKRFNFADLNGRMILDDQYGLCPVVQPPGLKQHYPSLPFWLARRRQRRETLREELRLLYVAFTRAQDTLILTGACSAKSAREKWPSVSEPLPNDSSRVVPRSQAGNALDWIGPALTSQAGDDWIERSEGATSTWKWRIHTAADESPLPSLGSEVSPQPQAPEISLADPAAIAALGSRLEWIYPFPDATRSSAKTSVSSLRRAAASTEDSESADAGFASSRSGGRIRLESRGVLSALEIGNAYHRFLQAISLANAHEIEFLRQEIDRLRNEGAWSDDELNVLELDAIAAFWNSDVGRQIRAHAAHVRREWPFTVKLTGGEAASLGLPGTIPENEWIVVQGIADLVVLNPDEIWLLDFKTDAIDLSQLAEKTAQYAPQLRVYAWALERILGRPVRHCWLHFLALRRSVSID